MLESECATKCMCHIFISIICLYVWYLLFSFISGFPEFHVQFILGVVVFGIIGLYNVIKGISYLWFVRSLNRSDTQEKLKAIHSNFDNFILQNYSCDDEDLKKFSYMLLDFKYIRNIIDGLIEKDKLTLYEKFSVCCARYLFICISDDILFNQESIRKYLLENKNIAGTGIIVRYDWLLYVRNLLSDKYNLVSAV